MPEAVVACDLTAARAVRRQIFGDILPEVDGARGAVDRSEEQSARHPCVTRYMLSFLRRTI